MIDGWIQDLLELFLFFARSFFLEGEMFSAVILIIIDWQIIGAISQVIRFKLVAEDKKDNN